MLQIFGIIYSPRVCIFSGVPAIEYSFARLKALMYENYFDQAHSKNLNKDTTELSKTQAKLKYICRWQEKDET